MSKSLLVTLDVLNDFEEMFIVIRKVLCTTCRATSADMKVGVTGVLGLKCQCI